MSLQFFSIGVIGQPHGHWGVVKVIPRSGWENRFLELKEVYLTNGVPVFKRKEIKEVRKYSRGRFLIKFVDVNTRKEAEKLRKYVINLVK